MTEDRLTPAGAAGGKPPALARQAIVAERVDPAVQADPPAALDAMRDRAPAEPRVARVAQVEDPELPGDDASQTLVGGDVVI